MEWTEFRPGRPGVLGLCVAACAYGLAAPAPTRAVASPIEVRGEVPEPGWVDARTLVDALQAAGLPRADLPEIPLRPGDRVSVWRGEVSVDRSPSALALGQPLPINTATAAELEALPDIGPSLAAAIVADRAANGDFASFEDLDRVRGIGPAKLASLRPWVRVDP